MAGGDEFFFANPLDGGCLHFILRKRVLRFPRVKDSRRETKLEIESGSILRLAIQLFLGAQSVFEERKARPCGRALAPT
jgi:hypothetical protein